MWQCLRLHQIFLGRLLPPLYWTAIIILSLPGCSTTNPPASASISLQGPTTVPVETFPIDSKTDSAAHHGLLLCTTQMKRILYGCLPSGSRWNGAKASAAAGVRSGPVEFELTGAWRAASPGKYAVRFTASNSASSDVLSCSTRITLGRVVLFDQEMNGKIAIELQAETDLPRPGYYGLNIMVSCAPLVGGATPDFEVTVREPDDAAFTSPQEGAFSYFMAGPVQL